jgi:hypothetical protein
MWYEEVLCTLGCVTVNLGKNTTMLQTFVLSVYIQPTHDRTAQSSSLSEMHRELGGSQAAIPVQVKQSPIFLSINHFHTRLVPMEWGLSADRTTRDKQLQ